MRHDVDADVVAGLPKAKPSPLAVPDSNGGEQHGVPQRPASPRAGWGELVKAVAIEPRRRRPYHLERPLPSGLEVSRPGCFRSDQRLGKVTSCNKIAQRYTAKDNTAPVRYRYTVSEAPTIGQITDVPGQIFEKFLADLARAGLPADSVARLRTTLIDERAFSERALRAAVLAEESLP